MPICAEQGVAVIARCILDEGGLAGFLTETTQFEDHDFRKTFFEEVLRALYIRRVDGLRAFIPKYAGSLARLAIKFVLAHPGITTAIASMNIEQYLEENLEALEEEPLSAAIAYELRTRHRWVRNFYTSKYWMESNDLDKANSITTSTALPHDH